MAEQYREHFFRQAEHGFAVSGHTHLRQQRSYRGFYFAQIGAVLGQNGAFFESALGIGRHGAFESRFGNLCGKLDTVKRARKLKEQFYAVAGGGFPVAGDPARNRIIVAQNRHAVADSRRLQRLTESPAKFEFNAVFLQQNRKISTVF